MHKCPDCGVETEHKWLNKFDGTSEEVGLCPLCGRVTVEGDEPVESGHWSGFGNDFPEGEFE